MDGDVCEGEGKGLSWWVGVGWDASLPSLIFSLKKKRPKTGVVNLSIC